MYKNQETISCTAKGKLEGDEIIVYCFKVTKPISYVSSAIGKLHGRNEGEEFSYVIIIEFSYS